MQGIDGENTNQGSQGLQGLQGLQGVQGYQGHQGTAGADIAQGSQGTQGFKGFQGPLGSTGQSGLRFIYSSTTSSSASLSSGEFTVSNSTTDPKNNAYYGGRIYINSNDADNNYVQNMVNSWNKLGSSTFRGVIQIVKSDFTVIGFLEVTGQYSTGYQYYSYPVVGTNLNDSTVSDFVDGDSYFLTFIPAGVQGVSGTETNQGAQGTRGFQGPQGTQGFSGEDADQGAQGTRGYKGLQGTRGFQGYTGEQGINGENTNQGYQGYQGTQGTASYAIFTSNSSPDVNLGNNNDIWIKYS